MKAIITQVLVALALAGIVLPSQAWAADCDYTEGPASVCSNDHKILQSQQRDTTVVFPNVTKVLTPDGTVTVDTTDIGAVPTTRILYGTNGIAYVRTVTITATGTNTSAGYTASGTASATQTASITFSGVGVLTKVGSNTFTSTTPDTHTFSQTGTSSNTAIIDSLQGGVTIWKTTTITTTLTSTAVGTATGTATGTAVVTITGTGTKTASASTTTTATAVFGTRSYTQYKTAVGAGTYSETDSSTTTRTGTAVVTVTATATTATATATGGYEATYTYTYTATATTTETATALAADVTITQIPDRTNAPKPSAVTADVGNVGLCSDSGHVHPLGAVIGGDRFLIGQADEGITVLQNVPYSDTAIDETAHPTSSTPEQFVSSRPFFYTVASTTTPAWLSPGEIKTWIWLKSTDTSTVYMFWGICDYPPSSMTIAFSTTVLVPTTSWQRFYTTIPLTDGMVLPENSSLCFDLVAHADGGGTPTVTLGTSGDHFSRVNGPWIIAP